MFLLEIKKLRQFLVLSRHERNSSGFICSFICKICGMYRYAVG